ncbi:MAG: cache domain-containing protein [Sulfurospirillaceae bacterium]|nr:cache domain-containing protein [Sulfurospirillaceae bacterium]
MPELEQEKKLLRLIKYMPMIIVLMFFCIMSAIIIYSYIQQNKRQIKDMKRTLIETRKDRLKNHTFTLIEHIKYEKKHAEQNLKLKLKARVEEAYNISMNIYIKNKNKNKDLIAKLVKEAIRPIRFNHGRGYYFIYDTNLKNILLPIESDLEGKDFSGYFDIKGHYVVRDIAKICLKKNSGFYTWYWRKPEDKKTMYKKLGYVKYFGPLHWFIGTGEYVSDFEKDIQNELINEIKDTKYGENNYFFAYKYNGDTLIDINESLIVKNNTKFKDVNQSSLIKKTINLAKKGGGFLEYLTEGSQNNGKPIRNIAYVVGFDEWKWVLGSGVYLKNMDYIVSTEEKYLGIQLSKTIIILCIIFSFMAIVLAGLLTFISKKSERLCNRYKNVILSEADKSKKQLLLIQQQNKLASMGEMLGNISHQWKQPLNSLSLSMSKLTLLKENGSLTEEIMSSSFERMEKSIIYLSKTIDVFRNFFIPTGNDEKFHLEEEINNTILIIQDSFTSNFIKIFSSCEKDIIINGDKKKLEQAFINILNNAKDAILSNNITNGEVKISAEKRNEYVKITIQDNAGGINEEIKDKVFEPYFTTKFKSQGTGVGLYMSKMIVENNFHGTLSFENTNKGVEFTITIPRI